jgi:hypothetical protein
VLSLAVWCLFFVFFFFDFINTRFVFGAVPAVHGVAIPLMAFRWRAVTAATANAFELRVAINKQGLGTCENKQFHHRLREPGTRKAKVVRQRLEGRGLRFPGANLERQAPAALRCGRDFHAMFRSEVSTHAFWWLDTATLFRLLE